MSGKTRDRKPKPKRTDGKVHNPRIDPVADELDRSLDEGALDEAIFGFPLSEDFPHCGKDDWDFFRRTEDYE